MPFNGDEFSRLGLPPYSGALANEFQNLADGLTLLKGETVTIDNETVRLAIGGMPGDGQVIKFDLATTSLVWRDDNVGMAGGGEENVQVDWDVTDTTSDAFIQNKPALSFLPLTGGTLTGPLTVPSIDFTRHALYHTIEPRLGQRSSRRPDPDRRSTAVHLVKRNRNRHHPAHWRGRRDR